ncbi:MAG TPA: hypothetical protein VIU62_15480 [Chloroflexota bacterium]
MSSETLGAVARKYAPARPLDTFRHCDDAALPLDAGAAPAMPLLLDMMVYLDRSAGKLPRPIRELIAARQHLVYHCGVVCAELAISIGILDPADPRTPETIAAIQAHLDHMDQNRSVSPSAAAWTEAALLTGTLARTQGLAIAKKVLNPDQECCQRGRRRELLLDALLYVTAIEQGMLLVSANVRHMDLLLQVRPCDNLLLYRPI